MLTDPIADMLTRIRNAVRNREKTVLCLSNKLNRGVAKVLKEEGFIRAGTTWSSSPSGPLT